MIKLVLPYPPSLNTLYPSNRKTGRRFLSKRGESYHDAVQMALRTSGLPSEPLSGRLAYRLHIYPPDARKRDLSNLPKVVEDCLTQFKVWGDDSQVDDMRVVRGDKIKGGKAVMYVWDLDSECEP